MNVDDALVAIAACNGKAALDALARDWRAALSLPERLALAQALWQEGAAPARLTAAKLLTQARIRPDDTAVWDTIAGWLPDVADADLADAVASAGQKRLLAQPARLDTVAHWTASEHLWTRRASLAFTLPWARLPHPKPADVAIRDRILGWAASLVPVREPVLHRAIALWLRDLAKHDAARARDFFTTHEAALMPPARHEIAQALHRP